MIVIFQIHRELHTFWSYADLSMTINNGHISDLFENALSAIYILQTCYPGFNRAFMLKWKLIIIQTSNQLWV